VFEAFHAYVTVFGVCSHDVIHHVFQSRRAEQCEWLVAFAIVIKHRRQTQRVIGMQMRNEYGSEAFDPVARLRPRFQHAAFYSRTGIEDIDGSAHDDSDACS
jgi:hypothetical protein